MAKSNIIKPVEFISKSTISYTPAIENIIYSSFVKYDKLQQLVFNTFSNTSIASATELNIFIDLYSILKSIFSETERTTIQDYTAITSGVINMCSHYRGFFKKLSVRTKFYLIFSFNTCEINRKFVAEYNFDFYGKSQIKMFNEIAMNNFDLMDILCPYLPDIFFVKSPNNYESSIVIANIIEKLNDGKPNLIISKDLYPLQLCTLYPYTSYLMPRKFRGEDHSTMIPINEKSTFRYEFWKLISTIRKFKLDTVVNLSPINFPLFCAINRFPERMITNSLGTSEYVAKIISSIVGSEDIKIIPQQLYENEEISSKIPVGIVEARLKTLDIQYLLPYYKNDPESKAVQFINLQDDATVNMINAKFFSHNPIDLGRL